MCNDLPIMCLRRTLGGLGGDSTGRKQLHALCSTLKAFSSWEMAAGLEVCRMACGGHGYLLASGIPQIYGAEIPTCTYEGENTILLMQTARFLNRWKEAAERGDDLPALASFFKMSKDSKSGLTRRMELDQIIAAYEYRTVRATTAAAVRVNQQKSEGKSHAQAWGNASQLLVQAALTFGHLFVVKNFIENVLGAQFDKSTEAVMVQVAKLYALTGILKYSGDFTKGGYMSDHQIELVQDSVFDLLDDLKPNAVALVDAFDLPDQVLGSALGRWDGNVYPAIMETANKSILNKTQVHPAFFKYQKPFMDSFKNQSKL